MSKLANSVMAHNSGIRYPTLRAPLCTVGESFVRDAVLASTEYRIGIEFKMKAIINDEEALTQAVKTARRVIVEEVFGEFRPYFSRIDEALYAQDFCEATRILGEFYISMFNVDRDESKG